MARTSRWWFLTSVLFFVAVVHACSQPQEVLPELTPAPAPTTAPAPPPAPQRQGAQLAVTIPVPESGASSWVRSTLVRITSVTFSANATSQDTVSLIGSNDNTIGVTAGALLGSFTGASYPSSVGQVGFNAGGYEYLAAVRTGGTTNGVSIVVVGDDGSSSSSSVDGGTTIVTANQGAPGDAGAPWYVSDSVAQVDLATMIASLATMVSQLTAISPAANGAAVTPSDSTVLSCTSLYVGGTGNVVVDFATSGANITLLGVPAGTTLPVQVTKVHAATTATSIVCLR